MTYALTPVTASCPACRHTDGRLLYATSSAEATQHYVRRASDPARHQALQAHIETLWGGAEARLVRCDACGLTFCDPFVAGDERFYTLAYERDTYPQHRWEFGVTRDDIARRLASGDLPASAAVLEVGAGDGAFVRAICPSTIPAGRVTCTEYSAYGRGRLAAEGVRVLADDVRTLGAEHDGAYDVIALFQVFEHMADLDALVGAFDRLLRPGGGVYISVPNGLRIDLQEQCGGLLDLPPNHTGRWTRSAFEAFAGRHRWRVTDHRIETDTPLARLRAHIEQRFMRSRQQNGRLRPRTPAGIAQRAACRAGPVGRSSRSRLARRRRSTRPPPGGRRDPVGRPRPRVTAPLRGQRRPVGASVRPHALAARSCSTKSPSRREPRAQTPPLDDAMNWKDHVRDALRLRGYDLVRHPLGRLLRRLDPTLMLDVGANDGHYGALVRRLGYSGRIVSFEPGAAAHARLAARAAADPLWQTHETALGDRDGDAALFLARDDSASSLLPVLATTTDTEPDTATVANAAVRVRRLDGLFDALASPGDRVFLKLDTQGSEAAILDGAAASLARVVGVQIEVSFAPLYDGETAAGVLLERMRASGFAFAGFEHGFLDPASKRLLQADAFFERV